MYDTPPKMDKKKKIELIILIVIIIWGIIFAIDYYRFSKSEHPILAIKTVKKYEDGTVTEYHSLGYVYRSYNRNAISKEEFVPFWVLRENPPAKNALPETYKDYEVPDNDQYLDKYKSLLYYYDDYAKLVGTYKCINTKKDCNKVTSGLDTYNIENADLLTAYESQPIIDLYNNQYAFVDDSYAQKEKYGEKQYLRTVYLFDVENNEILAKYEDVKFHHFDEYGIARIADNGDFIARDADSRKWGIMNISKKGKIKEVLPFEYDSITYDIDTGYYIMCKKSKWYVYDLKKKKKLTKEITDPIYDIWQNYNLSYYYKTGKNVLVNGKEILNFNIYRFDGSPLLVKENITNTFAQKNWIMYLDSNEMKLHFIDYTNEEKIASVQLNFTELAHDNLTHPAFEMELDKSGFLMLKVYNGRELKEDYKEISFSTVTWE